MTTTIVRTNRQTVHWVFSWRVRVRVAVCVLLGWPFVVEGDFAITCQGGADE